MKVLFRISLILAILLPIAWFGFNLSVFGGFVILLVTPFIAFICALGLLLLVPSSIIMVPINLIGAIRLWGRYGLFSIVPLLLIILGFLAIIPLNRLADNLCQTRFQRYYKQYERAVSEIEGSLTTDGDFNTPSGTVFLSFVPPHVYKEDDGTLTITFFVGAWPFPPRRNVYIYRSTGIIEKGSLAAKRWHHTAQVNEHWFQASD